MEDGLPKEDTVIQQPSLSTSLNSLNIDPTKSQNQTNLRDLKSENASSRPDDLDLSPGSSKPCTSNKLETLPPDKIVVALDDEHNNADNYSLHSIESFVCRICHNSENPERLVSPCLCKGTLTYVHIHCLERWISTSRCTTCELCQFQYNTQQQLRYSMLQSLRIWYSRAISRRALQEDCQMFSLLTLVAFGIIGTLLVAVQYYIIQGHIGGVGRLWTKSWLIFFLATTNSCSSKKLSQTQMKKLCFLTAKFMPQSYRLRSTEYLRLAIWWQSARDIQLILENRRPMRYRALKKQQQSEEQQQQLSQILYNANANTASGITTNPTNKTIVQQQDQQQQQPRQQSQQKQSQQEPHQSTHSDVTEEEVLINLNNSRHPDVQNHHRREGQQQQSSLHAENWNKATKPKMPLTTTKAVNINIAPLEEISNIGIGYVWV
uniref:RING-CH-type domain-containing protein n=1 Tax=Glossina palpalis gambiensis TaxID=67801 RepID=A0A1B0BKP2_9MUSC